MTSTDTARVDEIVGPKRKQDLIEAAADRMVLRGEFSRREHAVRYATQMWPDSTILVSRGQVWQRKGPTRDDDMGALTGTDTSQVTIEAVDRGQQMVCVGAGRYMNYVIYLPHRYDLVDWPADMPASDGTHHDPQPPAAALPPPEEHDDDDGEAEFDPRNVYVLIQNKAEMEAYFKSRVAGAPAGHGAHWLPMTRPYWSSRPTNCDDCYVTSLDAVSYLADPANLGNYRAGWPHFVATFDPKNAFLDHFNMLSTTGFNTDVTVAAYLGHWLWQSARGEVVAEHGGTVDTWDAGFMWGGFMADQLIAVFPLADPTVDLPVDHPLVQCAGQAELF